MRENHEIVDRLTGMKPAAVESESTEGTGGTAPAATLTNLARALDQEQRCIMLAREGTAESIRERIEDTPCMMRETGETRIARLYNKNRPLRVGDEDERVYRRAGGENEWIYNGRLDRYELRVGDEVIATFNDAAELDDPAKYPVRESEIESGDVDLDGLTAIREPFVPELEFMSVEEPGDELDRDQWDVLRVPSADTDAEDQGKPAVEIEIRGASIPLTP